MKCIDCDETLNTISKLNFVKRLQKIKILLPIGCVRFTQLALYSHLNPKTNHEIFL